MRVRLIAMVAVVTTTLVATGSAQQSIVRWGEHGQSSSTVSEDGEIGKHLILIDGRISASVRDGGHSLVIELQITNAGPVPVRAESTLVEFQVIRPQRRVLQRIESEALADRVRREGNGHAAAAEARGFGAMKTVVETVPVIDVKPNPAAATDPTQHATIVTMGSETVVRTVPDDGEWLRAQSEGAGLRSRSGKEAKRILERAFKDGVLPPGSLAAGSIYYQRDAGIEEVLVRIPLGNVVAEIPFTATRERRLIGRSSLRFR